MNQALEEQVIPDIPQDRLRTGDGADDIPPVVVPEQFVIDDAAKASWAVRKILEARAYAARVRQWAERELLRTEHEEKWLLRRFGHELEGWLKGELRRNKSRRRSIHLPGGTIGLRLQPARLEVVDEQCLLTWCRDELPAAMKVTVETQGDRAKALLAWQSEHVPECRVHQQAMRESLAKHHHETGEVPRGMAVRSAADQFYVR